MVGYAARQSAADAAVRSISTSSTLLSSEWARSVLKTSLFDSAALAGWNLLGLTTLSRQTALGHNAPTTEYRSRVPSGFGYPSITAVGLMDGPMWKTVRRRQTGG